MREQQRMTRDVERSVQARYGETLAHRKPQDSMYVSVSVKKIVRDICISGFIISHYTYHISVVYIYSVYI